MTEGTSKGLFIVVAIVIFGIFVGLTYTLFGSEGLTKDLKIIFENSIQKTENTFKGWNNVNFSISEFKRESINYTSSSNNSVEYTSDGQYVNGEGIFIPVTYFEKDANYRLTFEITKLEGSILNVGGHLHVSEKFKTYVDGKLQKETYLYGIPYVDDFKKHTYEVYFDTNWLENINGKLQGVNPSRPEYYYTPEVFITTNRTQISDKRASHKVKFENIKLEILK